MPNCWKIIYQWITRRKSKFRQDKHNIFLQILKALTTIKANHHDASGEACCRKRLSRANRIHFKWLPVGGDTNPGGPPWVVLAYRQAGLRRPQEAKLRQFEMQPTNKAHFILKEVSLLLTALLLVPAAVLAQFRLADIFSDNMVLQRDQPVHIWGKGNPGDTVLDPFAGSGTTLKMAKETGRNYLGIEISPEYCKIAERRVTGANIPLPFFAQVQS